MKPLTILTGASKGMGLAMARHLIGAGGTLVCISRGTNDELVAEAAKTGATLLQWSCDLADSAVAAARLEAWLDAQSPAVWNSATLINNAGVIPRIGPLAEAESADLANALRVGFEAPMQLTSVFLRSTGEWKMPRKVLNISSGLGRRAMASQAAYCASKAAMDHFTRCVALEEALKPGGAKLCALAPGVIDTGMQAQLRGADAAAFPDRGNFVDLKDGGRLASPDDAARSVLAFLKRPDFGSQPVADVRD
ncbi:MAG: SDR family NAD(P)-dependent oxidoreductase [Comamonadaceae bacterium]|nr:MAG: SDR family NAD(P)-dependent oxidoreductase [Comamonadaceae bacterium]